MLTRPHIPLTIFATPVILYSVITGQWIQAALIVGLALVLLTIWRCWQ
ncbi:hypothetical protein [Methanofollis formosanus]|nr:hypothetical protein [Methanofollis formosanus]